MFCLFVLCCLVSFLLIMCCVSFDCVCLFCLLCVFDLSFEILEQFSEAKFCVYPKVVHAQTHTLEPNTNKRGKTPEHNTYISSKQL